MLRKQLKVKTELTVLRALKVAAHDAGETYELFNTGNPKIIEGVKSRALKQVREMVQAVDDVVTDAPYNVQQKRQICQRFRDGRRSRLISENTVE